MKIWLAFWEIWRHQNFILTFSWENWTCIKCSNFWWLSDAIWVFILKKSNCFIAPNYKTHFGWTTRLNTAVCCIKLVHVLLYDIFVQLNKYETAPNFIFKTKTWHEIVCWFSWIYLFLPVLAWCEHEIVLFWSAEQFYDYIMQKLGYSAKSTNNPMSSFCLIEENMELSHTD